MSAARALRRRRHHVAISATATTYTTGSVSKRKRLLSPRSTTFEVITEYETNAAANSTTARLPAGRRRLRTTSNPLHAPAVSTAAYAATTSHAMLNAPGSEAEGIFGFRSRTEPSSRFWTATTGLISFRLSSSWR